MFRHCDYRENVIIDAKGIYKNFDLDNSGMK